MKRAHGGCVAFTRASGSGFSERCGKPISSLDPNVRVCRYHVGGEKRQQANTEKRARRDLARTAEVTRRWQLLGTLHERITDVASSATADSLRALLSSYSEVHAFLIVRPPNENEVDRILAERGE